MSRQNLQELIAATPEGGVLDLKNGEYTDNLNPMTDRGLKINKPNLTIVGSGAKIFSTASGLTKRPCFVVTSNASGLRMMGDVRVIAPDVPRRDDLEAQHGVELRGTPDASIVGWQFENFQGNSYYLGRDPITNLPVRNVILNMKSINAGRQHIALQAVKGFHIIRPYMDTCGHGHSSIVYEPNGHSDICQDGVIEDGFYRGNTGWCFSAGGQHAGFKDGNLANVIMRRMRSKGAFGILLSSGGERRGPFDASDCEGMTIANKPCVVARHFDGVKITNYKQPLSAGTTTPFDISPDCTNVITSLATP